MRISVVFGMLLLVFIMNKYEAYRILGYRRRIRMPRIKVPRMRFQRRFSRFKGPEFQVKTRMAGKQNF